MKAALSLDYDDGNLHTGRHAPPGDSESDRLLHERLRLQALQHERLQLEALLDYSVLEEFTLDGLIEVHKTVSADPEYKPAISNEHRQMGVLLTIWVLIRPFTALLGFGLCVNSGHWYLAPVAVLCGIWVFQRSFTNAHNLVHASYPLPSRLRRPLREILMTVYGLMFGYASHLFKEAHFEHHRPANRCGVKGDPESICYLPAAVVLAFGPVLTARIFIYGFRHARSRFDRVLGLLELLAVLVCIGLAANTLIHYFHGETLGPVRKTLAFYAAEAGVLLWLFPFNAAWLPHQKCYSSMIGAARNTPGGPARGIMASLVSQILVGGTRWHLLHHAYMGVPSCKLGGVAQEESVARWMAIQHVVDYDHGH